MTRGEAEPPQPKVASSSEALGQDPAVNRLVRAALGKNPKATVVEIATEVELDAWVVWRSVRRMRAQPYLRDV